MNFWEIRSLKKYLNLTPENESIMDYIHDSLLFDGYLRRINIKLYCPEVIKRVIFDYFGIVSILSNIDYYSGHNNYKTKICKCRNGCGKCKGFGIFIKLCL